jgi:hypothetical protein
LDSTGTTGERFTRGFFVFFDVKSMDGGRVG